MGHKVQGGREWVEQNTAMCIGLCNYPIEHATPTAQHQTLDAVPYQRSIKHTVPTDTCDVTSEGEFDWSVQSTAHLIKGMQDSIMSFIMFPDPAHLFLRRGLLCGHLC